MIPLFAKPKIVSEKENRAVFEIESLYPGYGVTIGNSLRRVLLSSLPGAAVVKMKVRGSHGEAPHEFSVLPGIYEDVIQIMLNLKKLRFKMFSDEPQKATLKIRGEKEALGKDFMLPSQLELVNKNEHVATLTDKKAELEIEIEVKGGIGYVPREQRKRDKLAIGEILVDAIFSPVRKVGYQVENMRVGERTDYDRLLLDVQTDGTISPSSAMTQAAKILVEHFSLVGQSFIEEKPAPQKNPAEAKKEKAKKQKTAAKKKPAVKKPKPRRK